MAVRILSEHLFRIVCDQCGAHVVARAENSWAAYQKAVRVGWVAARFDYCRDCAIDVPMPGVKPKRTSSRRAVL